MTKVPLTPAELQKHLDEQIGFIERSAKAFDDGFEDEAKRLALTIRVLVHDTNNSRSLLHQIGTKSTLTFHDTAPNDVPRNLVTYSGIVAMALGVDKQTSAFVAFLDDHPYEITQRPFDDWWSRTVFSRPDGQVLARKDLVLTAANQDGGGHVDPSLDETYRSLARGDFLDWSRSDEKGIFVPMAGPERAAIRQIAHELLRTLRPGMP